MRQPSTTDQPMPPRSLLALAAALTLAAAVLIVAGVALLRQAPTPPVVAAPPAPRAAAPAPTPAASIPAAISAGSIVTLPAGAIALYAPGGDVYGDVGGARAIIRERYDVRWVRAEIAGHGELWVAMGALAGWAVDLSAIPCSYSCNPNPTPTPAPTLPPPPKAYIIVNPPGTGDGGQLAPIATARPLDVAAFPTARPNP